MPQQGSLLKLRKTLAKFERSPLWRANWLLPGAAPALCRPLPPLLLALALSRWRSEADAVSGASPGLNAKLLPPAWAHTVTFVCGSLRPGWTVASFLVSLDSPAGASRTYVCEQQQQQQQPWRANASCVRHHKYV